jgi:hypothetical protein
MFVEGVFRIKWAGQNTVILTRITYFLLFLNLVAANPEALFASLDPPLKGGGGEVILGR